MTHLSCMYILNPEIEIFVISIIFIIEDKKGMLIN